MTMGGDSTKTEKEFFRHFAWTWTFPERDDEQLPKKYGHATAPHAPFFLDEHSKENPCWCPVLNSTEHCDEWAHHLPEQTHPDHLPRLAGNCMILDLEELHRDAHKLADNLEDDESEWEKAFPKLSDTARHTAGNPPAPIDLQLFNEVLVQVLPKTGFTRKGIVSGCLPNNLYHVKIGNATYRKHRK